ncbi:hypothetical protein BC937DRAFT_87711 [Endogone sp. FLAS-F59071]|nr:hypothetical protein BC937DRAFT_87711 [Endogone sp. FLAS-F59071]|eukprot:RUS19290.1 hypothetical protein BC937DRAFT_87711 [Endogone sp. FLAS-F59071]
MIYFPNIEKGKPRGIPAEQLPPSQLNGFDFVYIPPAIRLPKRSIVACPLLAFRRAVQCRRRVEPRRASFTVFHPRYMVLYRHLDPHLLRHCVVLRRPVGLPHVPQGAYLQVVYPFPNTHIICHRRSCHRGSQWQRRWASSCHGIQRRILRHVNLGTIPVGAPTDTRRYHGELLDHDHHSVATVGTENGFVVEKAHVDERTFLAARDGRHIFCLLT